jgi:hypothetical protein
MSRRRGRRPSIRSALFDTSWRFPTAESTVTVERATHSELGLVERAWSSARHPITAHWDWRRIAGAHPDHFMVRLDDEPVGLWAANGILPRASAYDLHYLEIGPHHRGAGIWGGFVLDLVCARAAELGARRVVFGALPELVHWYRRYGAIDRPVGWAAEPGLAPMSVPFHVVLNATERLDGFRG